VTEVMHSGLIFRVRFPSDAVAFSVLSECPWLVDVGRIKDPSSHSVDFQVREYAIS
jgi:hypothetical protein